MIASRYVGVVVLVGGPERFNSF